MVYDWRSGLNNLPMGYFVGPDGRMLSHVFRLERHTGKDVVYRYQTDDGGELILDQCGIDIAREVLQTEPEHYQFVPFDGHTDLPLFGGSL